MPTPIYTSYSCAPAYQLRWSLALFAHADLPSAEGWYDPLAAATETDDVRLLEYCFKPPNVWQFLLSTKPRVAPSQIIWSVKGRLQHLVRSTHPKAFRRNFSLKNHDDGPEDLRLVNLHPRPHVGAVCITPTTGALPAVCR